MDSANESTAATDTGPGRLARLEHPVQVGTALDLPPETAARIAAAVPANTRRNWASRWRAYALWCLTTGRAPLPASGETLAAYLDARAKELAVPEHLRGAVGRNSYAPLNPSSMAAHLGTLRAAHRIAGHESPDPYLATMAIKARAAELASDPDAEVGIRQATPVRGRDLARMLDQIDTGTPAGLRDRALLLLLYKTGRRGKEIAGLNLADVRDAPDPLDPHAPPIGLRVTFRTSKTNPHGLNREDETKVKRTGGDYCPYAAVRAWRLYLTGQGYKKGPLFPRLDRHGNLGPAAAGRGAPGDGRITPKTVRAIVHDRAEPAGLVPESGYRESSDGLPVLVRISAHSTRRGFVTDAFTRPDADPEKIGRHAGFAPGSRTLYRYRDVELGWDDDPTDGLIAPPP